MIKIMKTKQKKKEKKRRWLLQSNFARVVGYKIWEKLFKRNVKIHRYVFRLKKKNL